MIAETIEMNLLRILGRLLLIKKIQCPGIICKLDFSNIDKSI